MSVCECGEKLVCACCLESDPKDCFQCAKDFRCWEFGDCSKCNGTGDGDHCPECAKDAALRPKYIKSKAFCNLVERRAEKVGAFSELSHVGGVTDITIKWSDPKKLRDLRKEVEKSPDGRPSRGRGKGNKPCR